MSDTQSPTAEDESVAVDDDSALPNTELPNTESRTEDAGSFSRRVLGRVGLRHVRSEDELQREWLEQFDSALAVRIGLLVGSTDIPCDGFPEELNDETVEEMLALIPRP